MRREPVRCRRRRRRSSDAHDRGATSVGRAVDTVEVVPGGDPAVPRGRPPRVLPSCCVRSYARRSATRVGLPPSLVQTVIDRVESDWGTGLGASVYAPSMAGDPQFVAWLARQERSQATPIEPRAGSRCTTRPTSLTFSHTSPCPPWSSPPPRSHELVHELLKPVPTTSQSTYRARLKSTSRRKTCGPSGMGGLTSSQPSTTSWVPACTSRRRDRLVAVSPPCSSPTSSHPPERRDATGDRRWHAVLNAHDDLAQRVTTRLGGRLVKSTGDGTLAVFDGPAVAVEAAIEILIALPRPRSAGPAPGSTSARSKTATGTSPASASTSAAESSISPQPGRITVTTTVRDLIAGSGLQFSDLGPHDLKRFRRASHRARADRRTPPHAHDRVVAARARDRPLRSFSLLGLISRVLWSPRSGTWFVGVLSGEILSGRLRGCRALREDQPDDQGAGMHDTWTRLQEMPDSVRAATVGIALIALALCAGCSRRGTVSIGFRSLRSCRPRPLRVILSPSRYRRRRPPTRRSPSPRPSGEGSQSLDMSVESSASAPPSDVSATASVDQSSILVQPGDQHDLQQRVDERALLLARPPARVPRRRASRSTRRPRTRSSRPVPTRAPARTRVS